jgi:heat shock protein HslJ
MGVACDSPGTGDRHDTTAVPEQPDFSIQDGSADGLDPTRVAWEPTGVPWRLLSGRVGGSLLPLVDGYPITLTLFEREVGGWAPCNEYSVEMSRSGSEIDLAPEFLSTAKGCAHEVMESERSYLNALLGVDTLATSSDQLTLTGEDVELVFGPAPPATVGDLTGTVWALTRLIQGETVSNAAGARATLELFSDQSMLGSTGCRSLHGRYAVSGEEVLVTELAANGECPADLRDQDSHVLSVLGDGFRAALTGPVELILTSTGGQGLVYRYQG